MANIVCIDLVVPIRNAGDGGRGEQAPLLPFGRRAKGGKSALFKICYDHFDN